MNDQQLRLNSTSQDNGASSWLTTLSIKEEGYTINKQKIWDLIRIRYGWDLNRLPENCECDTKFTIEHALSCKKGGFISLRHNRIRNLTTTLLREVCHDVQVEPRLQTLTGETVDETTANITD